MCGFLFASSPVWRQEMRSRYCLSLMSRDPKVGRLLNKHRKCAMCDTLFIIILCQYIFPLCSLVEAYANSLQD